jgi:glycosyltransferase involved in cell wall biosynthesis
MKPRILWVNECSVLNTGYATYGHEVLNRLYQSQRYELAEHAIYVKHSHDQARNLPWVVYANMPEDHEEQLKQVYNSNPSNQFGEWRFEDICLDFKPHIVMDIRDFWMCSFEYRSPFRPYYNWVIMPTVDAFPQNEEWLSTYTDADGCFTYQDWSKKVLDHEGGGRIKTLGAASPAASPVFQPHPDRQKLKESMGLGGKTIIGTVMRNQRRKLYPDLFTSFKIFLEETKRDDVYLYCHTSYPDMGWDIPRLLLQNEIASKVLFTYVCEHCGTAFPSCFSDVLASCPRCGNMSAHMANVQKGVDNQGLSNIYNLFDLYVQYANSEGFGMPQLEAAACGVPVMAVDYSAMTDAIRKIGGQPIPLIAMSMELETGCFRAMPNNDVFIDMLLKFFQLPKENQEALRVKTREDYLKNYSWDTTAQKWANYFDRVDINKYEQAWHSQPKIINIPNDYPQHLNNRELASWLIVHLLQEPRLHNSFMEARLVRDLNYGVTAPGLSGMYYNDQSAFNAKPNWQPFSRDDAFRHFRELALRKNHWEQKRWQSIQAKR